MSFKNVFIEICSFPKDIYNELGYICMKKKSLIPVSLEESELWSNSGPFLSDWLDFSSCHIVLVWAVENNEFLALNSHIS